MSLLWKIGGVAVLLLAAFLLIRMYGGSRYNTGVLDERVKWEGKVAEANAAQLKGFRDGLARVQLGEVQYHETVRERIVPVTKTIVERATEYAQTPDGASLCLPAERVHLLDASRRALFDPTPTPAPGGGSDALQADFTGDQPGRLDVESAGGAESRPR